MNINDENLQRMTAEQLRARFNWQKVQVPKPWYPDMAGEELIGYYGGRTVRNGQYGQYALVIVHVPARGAYTISGSRVIQLFDSSLVGVGEPVRVVYQGVRSISGEREMKEFDLFTACGPHLLPEALPEVQS